MLNYIIYTTICLGVSYAIYFFVLKQEKSFVFNRFYLLITLLLCLLAPFIELEWFESIPRIAEIQIQPNINSVAAIQEATELTNVESISDENSFWTDILFYGYLAISGVLLLRFASNLISILKSIRKNNSSRFHDMKVVLTKEKNSISSFFNYLFVNDEDFENENITDAVIQHEFVHSKQLHSLDVLLVEIVLCFFWFNPFIWFYKQSILQNHEFIADESVIKQGADIENYSHMIIHSSNAGYSRFVSGFNFFQTKNRITMLHQSKSSFFKRTVKGLLALVLFTTIFTLSSFRDSGEQLIVVVDAAHGGEDPGRYIEKDVSLNISKILASYSGKKVKIIETRNTDKFISLNDRVKFINSVNPDLVVSLHSNAYLKDTLVNGVEAYYYDHNEFNEKSRNYSQILLENQLDKFSNRGVKRAGFFMIKNINCPGIVLELGFMTNERDRAILTSKRHQKEIAKSIYESLLEIRDQK